MAPPTATSPGEVKSTAPMLSPTRSTPTPSLVKRANPALITPYVFPPGCTFNYVMMSSSSDISEGFGKAEETFLYLPVDDNDLWNSCQPTGWGAAHGQANRIVRPSSVYRGAVCPSGWVAFEVGLTSQTLRTAVFPKNKVAYYKTLAPETWSTAQCCKSGDTFGKNYWNIRPQHEIPYDHQSICISVNPGGATSFASYVVAGYTTYPGSIFTNTITGESSVTTKTGIYSAVAMTRLTVPFQAGRAFYPAMSMEWFEEDNETLEPKWPTLTSDMLIPTWIPNEKVHNENGHLDHKGGGPKAASPPSMPNKVAVPVIAVLATLLALSLGALLFLLWKERKARRQGAGSLKIVEDHRLGIPMDSEAGSTAHLNGQTGDDMELREREVAR